jgi:hypothetical protein
MGNAQLSRNGLRGDERAAILAETSLPTCRLLALQLIQFGQSLSNQSGSSQWAIIRGNSLTDPAVDFSHPCTTSISP